MHDRGLYNRGQKWLEQRDLMGTVKGYIPFLGMVTIIMNDHPKIKWTVISVLAYFTLSVRE